MSFCQTRGAPFYAPGDTNFDDRDCIFVPESSGLAGVTCFHFLFLYIIDIIVLKIISLLLRVLVRILFILVVITILGYCPLKSSRDHP